MKKCVFIFITIFLLTGVIGIVSAVNTPPNAHFQIDISNLNLTEGDWGLFLIPVTNVNDFKDKFYAFETDYITAKKLCGMSSSFVENYTDRNGGYDIMATKKECLNYTSFLEDARQNHTLRFDRAFESYLILHQNNNYERPYSAVFNGSLVDFQMTGYGSNFSYFVVLEKLNYEDEIYFSDEINIPWNQKGIVEWKSYSDKKYILQPDVLDIKNPNKLLISFNENKIIPNNENGSNLWTRFLEWIKGLFGNK